MSSTKDTIGGHMLGTRDYRALTPAVKVKKQTDLAPFVLENVDIHVGLYETPMAEALAVLPPSLQPTIPGSISVAFYRAKDSAFGPFQLLSIGLGCRSGVKPHNLILQNYCSNPELAQVLSRDYGYPFTAADAITVDKGYHQVESCLVIDGVTVLRLVSEEHKPLPGVSAILKYPSPLHFVEYHGEKGFLRLDLGYEFNSSIRGKTRLQLAKGNPFPALGVTPTHPISATYSERVTMGIIQPKYVYDLEKGPADGGIRKIAEME